MHAACMLCSHSLAPALATDTRHVCCAVLCCAALSQNHRVGCNECVLQTLADAAPATRITATTLSHHRGLATAKLLWWSFVEPAVKNCVSNLLLDDAATFCSCSETLFLTQQTGM